MLIPSGDHTLRYYQQYIDVELGVLRDSEEVVHRGAAECKVRRTLTRKGSLVLTSERVLFLTPLHTVARWRNCKVSIPL